MQMQTARNPWFVISIVTTFDLVHEQTRHNGGGTDWNTGHTFWE